MHHAQPEHAAASDGRLNNVQLTQCSTWSLATIAPKQASRAAKTVKKILILATELGHVSRPCKLMGLSRDTFYRNQNAMADGGVEASRR